MANLYNVAWGDDTSQQGVSLPRKHAYPSDGTYEITATRLDTGMTGQTTIVIAANGPQITLDEAQGKPRTAALSILSPTRSNSFTVDWGDGTPPVSGVPRGSVSYTYAKRGTFSVVVTDERTGKTATASVIFPPDFTIDWTVTAQALGVYQVKAKVSTPAGVESLSVSLGRIGLSASAVTKNGPGDFSITTIAASGLSASEPLVLDAAGFTVSCVITPTKASSGHCEANVPLGLRHVSNAGFLGIGRGTWVRPFVERGVTEVELTWLNSNGSPYDGVVHKIAAWKEAAFGYYYGYTAKVVIPGTTTELRCKVGPDGTCSL